MELELELVLVLVLVGLGIEADLGIEEAYLGIESAVRALFCGA